MVWMRSIPYKQKKEKDFQHIIIDITSESKSIAEENYELIIDVYKLFLDPTVDIIFGEYSYRYGAVYRNWYRLLCNEARKRNVNF